MPTPESGSSLNPLIEARRRRAQPQRRRGRGWYITAGVFVFLILFGFFGLPPIVRSQAVKRLPEYIGGRPVSIEQVRLNPLTLSVTIEGLAIKDLDGTLFVGWHRLYVNFDSFSLFTGQWRFQDIELEGFEGRVSRDEQGRLNFQDIIAPATPGDVASVTVAESESPVSSSRPLYVGRVAVTGAKLEFADRSLSRPFTTTIGPISFDLKRFNTSGDARAPYQFDAVTESGERVAWSGAVSLDPVRSQGELTLADIRLEKYNAYHTSLHNADLFSGRFSFTGRYHVDLSGEAPRVSLEGGSVNLRDVSVGLRGSEDPVFNLNRFNVTGIAADLAANTMHIDRVAMEGGHAFLKRAADGTLNALALLKSPASTGLSTAQGVPATRPPPATGAVAATGPAIDFTLGEFTVTGLAVDVDDLATPRPAHIEIESIGFSLSQFSLSKLDQKLPVSLEVKLAAGGILSLSGEAAVQPLSAAAQLTVANIALASFSPYIEPFVNIRLAGGLASTTGSVLLENNALTFAGSARLDQLVTLDPVQSENFITWSSLALNGLSLTSAPPALHLDEVVLVDPSVAMNINREGTLNLAAAFAPPPAPTPDSASASVTVALPGPAPTSAPPPDVTVDKVALQNAKLSYRDHSVQPAARSAITLDGTITGLSSAQLARADVTITGRVDDSAPIAITGQLNPLGQPAYSQLTLDFTGVELPAFAGPYIGKFAGYELARGQLSLDVEFNLQDRQIAAKNVVTLDQFTLGARTGSPDATNLPVSLGIALLKDSSGKIVLDVPIKGSLDDPEFKIRHVVLRVITNVLVKAATSPFSLLGAAFGGGGDELAYQQLAPGAVHPEAAELSKLETIAKALLARPALQLDIQGNSDSADDRTALQHQRLQARLHNRLWEQLRADNSNVAPPDQLTITPEQNAELLLALYAETFPPREGAAAPVMALPTGAVLATLAPEPEPAPVKRNVLRRGPRGSSVHNRNSVTSSVPSPAPESSEIIAVPAGTPGAPSSLMTAGGIPVLTPELVEAKLAASIEVTADDLNALAEARAQAVRAWLIDNGQIPADRIYIIAVGTKGPRVEFTLR